MTDYSIEIDGSKINNFDSFHAVFKNVMGFPEFYGNNMNAWIDCMADIHEDTKMSKYFLRNDESLIINIRNTEQFIKNCSDVVETFIECTAFINEKRLKGKAPVHLIFR